MKGLKIFLFSFLVVLLVAMCFSVVGQAIAEPELAGKEKFINFFQDIDGLNIVLIIISTFFGGLWWLVRGKLKQIGELFLIVYDYTDADSAGGRKLTKDERAEIIARFMAILSKSTVEIDTKGLTKRQLKKQQKEVSDNVK